MWSRFVGEALYVRLFPVLMWGSVLSIQLGIFLLLAEVESDEIIRSLPLLWKPTGILLMCFALIWAFIAVTKVGITRDVVGLSWGPPGTPLTFGQVVFVFAVSVCIAAFYVLLPAKRALQTHWLRDAVIFTGLWALAALIWWKQPMLPSYFAPAPMAPNFEYYPNSDAAIFDRSSYQLLFGANFDTQLVRRPLYVAVLALYHQLAGTSYEGTIFLQILTLAFIPAVIYLLTAKLSNRLAGLLAGGLVLIREMNAIRLSNEINVSHAKLLMSDMLTLLGIVIVLYLSVKLFAKPGHNPWLAAIVGAVLGLTVLVRAQAVILLPMILLLFFISAMPIRTRIYGSIWVFLGFVVILSPWVWRNWNLTGTFVLDDRGEERLLARNYSSDPNIFPQPLANESEAEFSARMRNTVITYTSSNPGAVLFFVSNHFFHNLANGVLYISPLYSSVSPGNLLDLLPFWGSWDGTFTKTNGITLFSNLAIVAFGIVLAQQHCKLTGWLPLVVFVVYSGGNALVRSSGWRFSLPVDWIILMYYCIALAYIPSQIGMRLQKKASIQLNQTEESMVRPTFQLQVVFSLLLLMGASLPLAERLIPAKDYENFTLEASASLSQLKRLSPAEIDAFMRQDNAVFISGIALYPRYFQPNGRFFLTDMPSDYSYLHFWMIGNMNEQIVLPLQNVPRGIPNTSTVSVIGCKGSGYISAWAVIVHSQPKQILVSDPQTSLDCPPGKPK